jgi:ankyrin repeat protein
LHEAALKGQAAVAKYLLACGADANARGFGNDTPLHDACSNGFNECIQILIDHGANINIKNSDGQRPMDVCENDDCIAILSKKQKELERMSARDKAGRTSLHRACATGQLEDSLILIKKGADLNAKDNASWTPLHEAALNGYLDIVKVLCEHGAQLNPTGYDGSTPLHEASENGHTSVVRYLLNMSANKTIRNKKGQTAAEVCDDKSIVDLFSADIKPQLESPKDDSIKRTVASTSVADSKGSSPANSKAALSGSSISKQPLSREEKKIQALMETFQKMEKRQAKKARRRQQRQHDDDDEEDEDDEDEPVTPATKEPDYRTKRLMRGRPRSTSLSQSREASEEATQSKKPVMKLDPKRKDTAGRTQLHKWAVRGDETTVRELLEAGANANEKDHAGWTPLHEAALRGRLEVLKLLLQHGADPNALGADKDTPLHDAVENGHGDVVRVLLEHGANASARNATDLDCLQIAKDNEDDDMIAILKAAAQKQHPAVSSRQPKIEPSSEPNHVSLKTSKSTTVAGTC